MHQKIVVYGAQFGSEGKGAFAEYVIKNWMTGHKLVVFGENAPNSGHTNSLGKTRSLPVSAWYADDVVLGPDSAINPELLAKEIEEIWAKRGQGVPRVWVHENAAVITANDTLYERQLSLDKSIGSTVTGGGSARWTKGLMRNDRCVMRSFGRCHQWSILDRSDYYIFQMEHRRDRCWLFECSQGLMLDMNLGYYPYVTSRSTHPRVAIERNGLGHHNWEYYGVHRTFPIRTGGNSGPTGGKELTWEDVGVEQEIATVTKRIRRVFEFSGTDFLRGIEMVRPDGLVFTHLDYLKGQNFRDWLIRHIFEARHTLSYSHYGHLPFFNSAQPGNFAEVGPILYNLHKEQK